MWASNLVREPRVGSGERNEVMLARKGLRKDGGRIQSRMRLASMFNKAETLC
jgi:hypothetical protein